MVTNGVEFEEEGEVLYKKKKVVEPVAPLVNLVLEKKIAPDKKSATRILGLIAFLCFISALYFFITAPTEPPQAPLNGGVKDITRIRTPVVQK